MTDLNKLNTNELVSKLSSDKKPTVDIRALIQQKTIQAKQLKKNANTTTAPSIIHSINFNETKPSDKATSPKPQLPQMSIPKLLQIPPPTEPAKNSGNDSKPDTKPTQSDDDDLAAIEAIINSGKDPSNEADDEADENEDDDEEDGEFDDDNIDDDEAPPKNNAQIILQEETKSLKQTQNFKPQKVNDVKLPPNIDFGVGQLANKAVLEAISDDDEDDAPTKAKKMFQNGHKSQKFSPKQKSKIRPSSSHNDEDVDTTNHDDDEAEEDDENEDADADADAEADHVDETEEPNETGGLDDDAINQIGLNGSQPSGAESETELNLGGGIDSDDEDEKPKKPAKRMTRHELAVAKRKELTKLERLNKKGYKPCKKFGMSDSYDDIVAERERLDDEKGCDESIKWQRKMLMGASTGIEYLNKVYDPFDLQLEGWSESVYENINDYDEVFEELYHKYKKKVKVAPEIKLIGMFAGSAMMFHFSKTLFSKASDQVPGFDDVMRENPDIKAAYEQAALKKLNMNNDRANNPMSSMIGNFLEIQWLAIC